MLPLIKWQECRNVSAMTRDDCEKDKIVFLGDSDFDSLGNQRYKCNFKYKVPTCKGR